MPEPLEIPDHQGHQDPQEHREDQVLRDHLELQDPQDHQEPTVLREVWALQDQPVRRDYLEPLEQEIPDPQDQLALQELQVQPAIRVQQDLRDPRGPVVDQEDLDQTEAQDRQDPRDLPEPQDLTEQLDSREDQGPRVQMVHRDPQVTLVRRGLQGLRARMETRGQSDNPDQPGQLVKQEVTDSPDRKVPQVDPVRQEVLVLQVLKDHQELQDH